MPPVARVGVDFCSGHAGLDARPALAGSMTVFCNGIAVVRVGDPWTIHPFGILPPPHSGTGLTGSGTVFCDGVPLMRVGDTIDCGTVVTMGSPDVQCGG